MTLGVPNFYDSPFFVDEPGNWHLKPGAPADVVKEFNDYMKALKELDIVPKSDLDELEEV